jgi:hypothetical protein
MGEGRDFCNRKRCYNKNIIKKQASNSLLPFSAVVGVTNNNRMHLLTTKAKNINTDKCISIM